MFPSDTIKYFFWSSCSQNFKGCPNIHSNRPNTWRVHYSIGSNMSGAEWSSFLMFSKNWTHSGLVCGSFGIFHFRFWAMSQKLDQCGSGFQMSFEFQTIPTSKCVTTCFVIYNTIIWILDTKMSCIQINPGLIDWYSEPHCFWDKHGTINCQFVSNSF